MKTIFTCATVLMFFAAPARAEMSEAAIQTGGACLYVGGMTGLGTKVIQERHAKTFGLVACGVAAIAVGGYNYFYIPGDDAPSEKDLKEKEAPVSADEE